MTTQTENLVPILLYSSRIFFIEFEVYSRATKKIGHPKNLSLFLSVFLIHWIYLHLKNPRRTVQKKFASFLSSMYGQQQLNYLCWQIIKVGYESLKMVMIILKENT